jgi:hypothetical protein
MGRCRSFRRRDGRIKVAPTRCAQPAACIKVVTAANLRESPADAPDNAAGRPPPEGAMSTRSGRSSRAFHRLRRGENSRPGYARGLCSATDVAGLRQRGDTKEKVAWLGLFLSSVASTRCRCIWGRRTAQGCRHVGPPTRRMSARNDQLRARWGRLALTRS